MVVTVVSSTAEGAGAGREQGLPDIQVFFSPSNVSIRMMLLFTTIPANAITPTPE